MHVRAAAAAALCLLASAPSCTSERQAAVSTGSPSSPTGTSSPSTGPTTSRSRDSAAVSNSSEVPPTSAPEGTILVTSAPLGVSFAVPETYTVLDPTELDDDFYQGAAFEELALRAGLAPEEFQLFLEEAVDLYVFAPAASEGYVDNVTMQGVDGTALPSEDQFSQTLGGLGATALEVRAGESRRLPFVQGSYEILVGDTTVYGVNTQVLIDERPVELTVTASRRDIADELGALVLDTVRPA